MKVVEPGTSYDLLEIGEGGSSARLTFPKRNVLEAIKQTLHMLLDRTVYLNNVLPCVETGDAVSYLLLAIGELGTEDPVIIKTINPGHIYHLWDIDGEPMQVVFIKRSGGAVTYEREWPGIQSQEVIRALIAYIKYHRPKLQEVIDYLRLTLEAYERRAFIRKAEEVNRKAPSHDDSERPRAWREYPYSGIPFNHENIEERPIDPKDGHLLLQ